MLQEPWWKVALQRLSTSLTEFTFLVIFAFMPLWLGAFLTVIFGRSLKQFGTNFLSSGEALLLCAATIGPLMYFITKDYDKRSDGYAKSFPGKLYLSVAIISICVTSAAFIGVQSAPGFAERVSRDALRYISLGTITASTIVWFWVMTVKNTVEYSSNIMRQDTDNFIKDWRRS